MSKRYKLIILKEKLSNISHAYDMLVELSYNVTDLELTYEQQNYYDILIEQCKKRMSEVESEINEIESEIN